jgi:DnaK suppressor protein
MELDGLRLYRQEERTMNKRQLQRYRKELLAKREELLDLVRSARASEQDGGDKEAPDLGDRALSTVIRDLSYQLSATERDIMRRIDEALDRIEKGDFGVCVECEKKMQTGRLDAVPWARHCIECQELQDRGEI